MTTETEIRLEAIVEFQRLQVASLSEALAAANGEIGVLRAQIATISSAAENVTPSPAAVSND